MYRTITLDMSTGGTAAELIQPGYELTSVAVLELADAAQLELHFGRNADPIQVRQGYPFKLCGDDGRNGLFATFPAQPGVSAKIFVAIGGGASAGVGQ